MLAVYDRSPVHACPRRRRRPKLFKYQHYRHFEPQIILLSLRRYLRYSLSYRDLEEIMVERGLSVDHTTIYRSIAGFSIMLRLTKHGGRSRGTGRCTN